MLAKHRHAGLIIDAKEFGLHPGGHGSQKGKEMLKNLKVLFFIISMNNPNCIDSLDGQDNS